jgi:hypothetical protein
MSAGAESGHSGRTLSCSTEDPLLSLLAATWLVALAVMTGLFVAVVAWQAVAGRALRRSASVRPAAAARVAVPAPRPELDRLPVGATTA